MKKGIACGNSFAVDGYALTAILRQQSLWVLALYCAD